MSPLNQAYSSHKRDISYCFRDGRFELTFLNVELSIHPATPPCHPVATEDMKVTKTSKMKYELFSYVSVR